MSETPEKMVADVVAAHGGTLVGRIRLQKVVYLLDQLGLDSGFTYAYHHYGPYSSELAAALTDAQTWGLVIDEPHFRQTDGAAYSVFKSKSQLEDDQLGSMPLDVAKDILGKLQRQPATVLELAATIHWLREFEEVENWEEELRSRKGSKTDSGRMERAVEVLQSIDLFD